MNLLWSYREVWIEKNETFGGRMQAEKSNLRFSGSFNFSEAIRTDRLVPFFVEGEWRALPLKGFWLAELVSHLRWLSRREKKI